MTNSVDHADEAWKLIERYTNASMPSAEVVSGMMQAHAMLAVAAQQRIANLIAIGQYRMGEYDERVRNEIKEGLGLS